MNVEPDNWSVVIAGSWNRAILTPMGIQSKLFEIPTDKKEPLVIDLEVPVDGLGPYRVTRDDITIMVEDKRLVVETKKEEYPILEKAMKIGVVAMKNLPETPFIAAGFNLRFLINDFPADFFSATNMEIDNKIVDSGYDIKERRFLRSLEYGDGFLNVDVIQNGTDAVKMSLNFHRASKDRDELTKWLGQSVEDIEKVVNRIIYSVMGLGKGEDTK